MKMFASNGKNIIANKTKNFTEQTTIHGLPFVGKNNLHPIERICWGIIVISATSAAVYLCLSNWYRFSANPTVVTIQKDFRNWYNYFPAATGCYLTKYHEELAENYIMEKWGINETFSNYSYYLDFIKVVTNVSYSTLNEFKRFEHDPIFKDVDMFELTVKVLPPITGNLVTFDTKKNTYWKIIMTELGLCFTLNSKFWHLLSIKDEDKNRTKENYILKCHYLNGLCYARYDSDPTTPLKLYVHSYLDVIHATTDLPLLIKESEELEINYRMQETTAGARLRDLYPIQRGCRFDDEPLSDEYPVYSTSFCFITCRYRLVMKLCGCRPFFYHTLKGKLCDIKGLLCVAKHSEQILQPPSKIGCHCPQACNLIKYLLMAPKRTVWQYGYFDQRITFRWGLLPPTTKYNRDVLFGFGDLVVAFGGISALFLGVSFISGIEIMVFIVETLVAVLCKGVATKKRSEQHKKVSFTKEKMETIKVAPVKYEKQFHIHHNTY